MYQSLLTNRYLTSRVIPLIAVAAVALCVALVIIVVSVMTGFLDMVKSSGRALMGDVVISYSVSGIPHYERLIERLEALPEVAAASPVVDSWGLLQMPYPKGATKEVQTVQIWAIEPRSFAAVTGYDETLYWKPPTEAERETISEGDIRTFVGDETLASLHADGVALTNRRSETIPAAVLGMHVSVGNDRQSDGSYMPAGNGFWWMPQWQVTLTMVPLAGGGFSEPESVTMQVVNEFTSGVFLIDKQRIMIPLATAQRMLRLDEADRIDPEDPETVLGVDPARVTMVLVRAAEGIEPDELRDIVDDAYDAFFESMRADETTAVLPPSPESNLTIQTWEQQQSQFIAPIEKEREVMRTLFSLVYLVCAGLVLSIFWAIVYEKTRDIGILRSIGASRLGISWIFLRYGFVIGIFGAIFGLGLGWLVVHYINAIHSAMGDPPVWLAVVVFVLAALSLVVTITRSLSGRLLPLVLGSLTTLTLIGIGVVIIVVKYVVGGVVIWDPSIYYFTVIPNEIDRGTSILTMVGAVVFSLVGAFLPAAKAADTDPVKALRYE